MAYENKKSMMENIKKGLIAKLSIVSLGAAVYLGATYHSLVERAEDNLLHRNIQVEQGFFPDPRGLDVLECINGEGKKEIYLVHGPSEKKYRICEDMLPASVEMMDCLEDRVKDMQHDEACSMLRETLELQEALYHKLGIGYSKK